MEPTADTALIRPDLGLVVYEAMQSSITMGFIGLSVMPLFAVDEFSATYMVMAKEALFNLHETKRNSDGSYRNVDEEFEDGFYKTVDHGLEMHKDDRKAKIYSTMFDYESVLALLLLNKILRAHEYRVKTKVFNTDNFTAHNAATKWETVASAVPKTDVNTGKETLRGSGIEADTLVLTWKDFLYCQTNADIKDQVYQLFPDAAKTGTVTVEHLKTYFDVPKLFVAGGLYNSAKKGQAATLAAIWGSQYAMLCKTADPGDDITVPSIGRTILWNEGMNDELPIIEEYRKEGVRGNKIRVRHDSAEVLLASYDEDGTVKSEISKACGYLIDTTKAS